MANKHTPGPWRFVKGQRIYTDEAKIIDSEGATILPVPDDDTMEIDDGAIAECVSAQRKANAELIAAAPALADALKELLAEAEAYEENGSRFDRERNDRARAALKSAGVLP